MLRRIIGLFAAALLASSGAYADLINPQGFILNSPLGNPADERAYIENNYTNLSLTYLVKYDVDESQWEDGALQGANYFSLTISGDTGSVSWDLAGSGYELRYVLLKGGNPQNSGHIV